MASKSKFFRVAVEGGTTDGRIIERAWLEQMATTYKPDTYGARVNMEHIRGYSADKPFCAYGDVVALKTETIALDVGGKTEQRLALFAQIDPTKELLEINARRQKVYTSIEIEPNFRGTGQAYLMGVAVTDTPASLGTEMLAFAAANPAIKAMFDARKSAATALFTASIETNIELDAEAQTPAASDANLVQFLVSKLFSGGQAQATAGTAPAPAAANPALAQPSPNPGQGGDQYAALFGVQQAVLALASQIDSARQADRGEFAKLQAEFAALKTSLDAAPNPHSTQRPGATGGTGLILAEF